MDDLSKAFMIGIAYASTLGRIGFISQFCCFIHHFVICVQEALQRLLARLLTLFSAPHTVIGFAKGPT